MITIREASLDDRREIWEWWNDPTTRKMMYKNDPVSWEEHCLWFSGVLTDESRILCVGEVRHAKIGVVRFDLRGVEIYEVSINLGPDHRGKGYGSKILIAAENYLCSIRSPKKLFAKIKKINVQSQKSFAGAEFVFIDRPVVSHKGLENYNPSTEVYCERIPAT